MTLVDLTLEAQDWKDGKPAMSLEERLIVCEDGARFTGMVYHFDHDSMLGTYIDFPGHIKETDDGKDAANYPLERLFRIDASVIHLDREDGSGAVEADELERAMDGAVSGALVINALGNRRWDEIEERSVYLATSAVDWIVEQGVDLLVSDIYESKRLHGVFPALFRNGISTVCYPINLDMLTATQIKLTILPVRYPTVTQIPCRIIAELEEKR
jgi:kynurenine formamidase